VEFIRKRNRRPFQIKFAAYPEAHPQARIRGGPGNFIRKAKSGGDSAITPSIFTAGLLFSIFVDRVQQGRRGIIPSVPQADHRRSPITARLARFSTLAGAESPRWHFAKHTGSTTVTVLSESISRIRGTQDEYYRNCVRYRL